MQLVAHAYTVDPSFRPENSPFAIEEDIKNVDATAGGGAILILQVISGALLYFAAPLAVVMITFSGLTFARAGADTEAIDSAKKHLIWTLVGLAVIILSWSIVRAILQIIIGAAEAN